MRKEILGVRYNVKGSILASLAIPVLVIMIGAAASVAGSAWRASDSDSVAVHRDVQPSSCASDQALTWNGSSWVCATVETTSVARFTGTNTLTSYGPYSGPDQYALYVDHGDVVLNGLTSTTTINAPPSPGFSNSGVHIDGCPFGSDISRDSSDIAGRIIVGNDGRGAPKSRCHVWFAKPFAFAPDCVMMVGGDGDMRSVGFWYAEATGLWGDWPTDSVIYYACAPRRK